MPSARTSWPNSPAAPRGSARAPAPRLPRREASVGNRRLLWVLLLGLGVALLALIIRHDDGTIGGLATHDFAALAVKVALAVFIGSFVIAMFRYRLAAALEAAVFWVVIALCPAARSSSRAGPRDV